MTTNDTSPRTDAPLWPEALAIARHYLGGRRGLLLLSGVLVVGGAALNWGWLVAAGIAPLILGVLPCVVMCALGICVMRKCGNASTAERPSIPSATASPGEEMPIAVPRDAIEREADRLDVAGQPAASALPISRRETGR